MSGFHACPEETGSQQSNCRKLSAAPFMARRLTFLPESFQSFDKLGGEGDDVFRHLDPKLPSQL